MKPWQPQSARSTDGEIVSGSHDCTVHTGSSKTSFAVSKVINPSSPCGHVMIAPARSMSGVSAYRSAFSGIDRSGAQP